MHYKIKGASMEPSFSEGSVVFALRVGRYRKGDVVLLKDPRNQSRIIIKRVASAQDGGVVVLGDNTHESTDSRAFGAVDKALILGKVIFKYPKPIVLIVMVTALVGLVDSAFLTFKHFSGGEVFCGVMPGADCDLVLGSVYSEIFSVPLALIGALYYLAVLGGTFLYMRSENTIFLKGLWGMTLAGFVVSLYLIYLQLFVLYALCAFCLVSALASMVLVGLTSILMKKNKGRRDSDLKNE